MLQPISRIFGRFQWDGYKKFGYRCRYSWVFDEILRDKIFIKKCRNAGMTHSMVTSEFKNFKKDLVFDDTGTKMNAMKVQYVLSKISKSELMYSSIFPFFLNYAKGKLHAIRNKTEIRKICDLTRPAEWYPSARSIKRSVIFHAGPTNSGKTHSALEKFLSSGRGIYCSPLRLLAREISQKSRSSNIPCSLITGEEKDLIGNSSHVSCTVEMANLRDKYDVGVIDEIQIIEDEERGWAWTQALLGLNAKEIHVCGESRAISIVEKLCQECGDDFKINEYQRLTKLRVKKYAVGSVDQLRSGDCVVCFKRRDIYSTISQLKNCGKDAAVIYGKLPPAIKRMEAQKFNDPHNSCDILVATDAIGMGLNLNIKRIVFQALNKGVRNDIGVIENTELTTPQALQIAGRAGRFGLQESGEVTTLYDKDISMLHQLLSNPKEDIKHARILPMKQFYLKYAYQVADSNLLRVLLDIRRHCQIDKKMFALSSQRDSLVLAESIQRFKLPIAHAYLFSLCPINYDSEISRGMYNEFAQSFSRSKPVRYNYVLKLLKERFLVKIPILAEIDHRKIAILEDIHNVLGAYLWLAQKFPKYFPDKKQVSELHQSTISAIGSSLRNVRYRPSREKRKAFERKNKMLRQKSKPIRFY